MMELKGFNRRNIKEPSNLVSFLPFYPQLLWNRVIGAQLLCHPNWRSWIYLQSSDENPSS